MYDIVLPLITTSFGKLEPRVPPPQLVMFGRHKTYRFIERRPEQAILIKLARIATGIQSAKITLDAGFTQEVGALQRIVDELCSDIMFLTGPLVGLPREPAHDQYLQDFFQEEFTDPEAVVATAQKRNPVPRAKIRAYIARVFNPDEPTDVVSATSRAIENSYSGFVHGAGVHAMDTYFGSPPTFHIDGSSSSPFLDDAYHDFRNYLHRALLATAMGAKALGDDELCRQLTERSNEIAGRFRLWPGA